ncbi:CRISPR/Cas system-associated endoribonuclease Cas2 [Paenibacillus sp. 4624]
MPSTNCAIHRNVVLNTNNAITNVLERTDKLIKDYRFFLLSYSFRTHKDKERNTYINEKNSGERKCTSNENQ